MVHTDLGCDLLLSKWEVIAEEGELTLRRDVEDVQAAIKACRQLDGFTRGAIACLFATDERVVVYIELLFAYGGEVVLAVSTDDLFLLAVRGDDEVGLREDTLKGLLIIDKHITRR